jgi:hypothetical protein
MGADPALLWFNCEKWRLVEVRDARILFTFDAQLASF